MQTLKVLRTAQVEKGRVGPGELLVIDTRKGKLWQSSEIDNDLKSRHPYREWMDVIFYFLLQIKVSKDKPKSVFVLRGKLASSSYCIFRLFPLSRLFSLYFIPEIIEL